MPAIIETPKNTNTDAAHDALDGALDRVRQKTESETKAALRDYVEHLREGLPPAKIDRLREIMRTLGLSVADVRDDLNAFRVRQQYALDWTCPGLPAAVAAMQEADAKRARLREAASRQLGMLPSETAAMLGKPKAGEPSIATQLADADREAADAQNAHGRLATAKEVAGRKLAVLKVISPRVFGDALKVPEPRRRFDRPNAVNRDYLASKIAEGKTVYAIDGGEYATEASLPSQQALDLAYLESGNV